MSSPRDRGSALIEALVIGSAIFIIAATAISASMTIVHTGAEAAEAARSAAVHAARHGDVAVATDIGERFFRGGSVEVSRDGDTIRVAVVDSPVLAHPDAPVRRTIIGRAEMPLAPFRSDRG